MLTSPSLNAETGLFSFLNGVCSNWMGLMYDTVQTLPDVVARICMSFQSNALDSKRGNFFYLTFFSNGVPLMSFGAFLKNTTQRNNQ
ncbi:hypothetical protein B0F88_102118 [Methylobacter tundripaludum]|uniref:Uncharacterized protein n=1 Tax=Methylobacter tundripaludum TaxID=173365 RepID=A0A2S6H6M7_9GAMM|nr:hypothetical protein B0F88_102118 [Methylobacter tundripaludum]